MKITKNLFPKSRRESKITMFTPSLNHLRSSVDLPLEVSQAANRHWRLFPVQELSRFAEGKVELATCDIDELERLASEYPDCNWALATGQASGVFVLEMAEGARATLHAFNAEECECEETLQSKAGEIDYAFFRWPADRILCRKIVAPGLRIRGENDFVLIPPSTNRSGVSHAYRNPDAEIMTSPNWLLRAFNELEEKSSGNILPFPVSSPRLAASANRAAESSTAKILPFNLRPTPRK